MICQTCHGNHYIRRLGGTIPCPDCIGGVDHCCNGDTAANDPPEESKLREQVWSLRRSEKPKKLVRSES